MAIAAGNCSLSYPTIALAPSGREMPRPERLLFAQGPPASCRRHRPYSGARTSFRADRRSSIRASRSRRPASKAATLRRASVASSVGLVEIRPIRMQLVTSVLGTKIGRGVDGEASRCVSRWRSVRPAKMVGGFIRVIAPDAAASLEFRTRLRAMRLQRAIFQLAGIGRGADVDRTWFGPSMTKGCMGWSPQEASRKRW